METRKPKIKAAILGATGMVGQRFVQLLSDHPWFVISALASSERSAGKVYAEACHWRLEGDMPAKAAEMMVQATIPPIDADVVFSALPADVARDIEPDFARAGYTICSNSSAFRYDEDVPVIIPEINADHIVMLEHQKERKGWTGRMVTSPNCTTTGAVFPMKPIDDVFGIEKVFLVSMQAVSGAGYPGVPYLSIADNVIPFISGEEKKLEIESRLLLGKIKDGKRLASPMVISAQANRVPVIDGHTICLSLALEKKASPEEVREAIQYYSWPAYIKELPSAPAQPLLLRSEPDRPQPRLDRMASQGMSVSVGRLRDCPILDIRLVSVVHNTLRGAASGSILNAELLAAKGLIG